MNVLSTRSTEVIIDRRAVTDLSCRESAGKTTVEIPEKRTADGDG
jgi:hypothetical protein